jgi:histidyl-tRNA synthetase
MADPKKNKLTPKLPRGFADRGPEDIRAVERMMAKIKAVYERYGFEPVETPFVEYTEALGKFLPDQDRPNEGVFSFQDDDDSWLSLRYDLTAPLARYVAENYDVLPKPYRSYRAGWVFRNEKPGPGRFRQFMQFDADTVGAASVAADAEICMMAADTMEALGFERGQYVIKVNNRKVFDGVLEAVGVTEERQRLAVFRSIDKADKFPIDEIKKLLGSGRKDESGDFTPGANLTSSQTGTILEVASPQRNIEKVVRFFGRDWNKPFTVRKYKEYLRRALRVDELPLSLTEGLREVEQIRRLLRASGYTPQTIRIDPSVVRGLEYYTGPVFEAQLTFQVPNEKGEPVVFGSVGGGGRYDGLVGRFRGEDVPATGFSVGVSRLAAALKAVGKLGDEESSGPVVVTVMDREKLPEYQRMVADLRNAGIPAEMYLGSSGMKAQLKYADRRNSPAAIIAGTDEFASGKIQIKDLAAGKAQAAAIADNRAWREERPGQFEVSRSEIVAEVRKLLDRQKAG